MRFIKAESIPWEDKPDYSKKVLLSERDLAIPGVRVQQIKIKPGESAQSHHRKIQTEIFYLLNDNGYFVVNGTKQTVEPGEVIVIGPNDRHEVVNNTADDFLYIGYKINYHETNFLLG